MNTTPVLYKRVGASKICRDNATVGANMSEEGRGFALAGQMAERRRGGGRDGVEDPEQRVRIALFIAGDQFRIVEIVARIHAHVRRQAPAHRDLLVLVEQRDLHAIDLAGVAPR